MTKPDLTVALKDIRAQYEVLSSRNQQQAEEWYRSKFSSVTEATARDTDSIKQTRDELSACRRQVQARTLEIEALRNHNDALERQLAEMEDRHSTEIGELQVRTRQTNTQRKNTALYLCMYSILKKANLIYYLKFNINNYNKR